MNRPDAIAPLLPLALRNVCFAHRGRLLLDDVSLTIAAGQRLVVLGPNGAGKSLLMRLCHGLLRPTAGEVRWGNGTEPGGERVRFAQAMVFQRPVMLRRSALANVTHALALRGMRRGERHVRAYEALREFGLEYLAERSARVLSGGEQQRLALARAWALRPEILFLDEPTAALDPAAAIAVERAIERFHRRGVSLMIATHDLGFARRLGEGIVFICGGRVLEHAPVERFFDDPETVEAAAFVRGDLVPDFQEEYQQ